MMHSIEETIHVHNKNNKSSIIQPRFPSSWISLPILLQIFAVIGVAFCFYQGHIDSAPSTKPIEQVKVGEWVRAEAPTDEQDLKYGNSVTPATWKKLKLHAPKTDGSYAEVT